MPSPESPTPPLPDAPRRARRPAFASAFPSTPALDALVDAFARGDYATVRAQAPALAQASDDPAIKAAAQMLMDRTRPDPLSVALLAIAAILLVAIGAWAIAHGHSPGQ
jgi:hypothetical protein